MNATLTRYGDLALLTVAILLAWQALHWTAGGITMASPIETLRTLAAMLGQSGFWVHVAATLKALGLAVVISMVAGVALGLALGAGRTAGPVMEPVLVSLYSLPKVTLYPLVLLVFGLGISAKVAFGAMHGLIPVALITMNAVRQMRPAFLRTARVMRLTRMQIVWSVMVPAILPALLSALRLGFSLSLLGVLIGEMFAAKAGLGFLLMNAIAMNDVQTLLAVTTLLFIFAIAVNSLLRRLATRGARA